MSVADVKCSQATWQTVPNSRHSHRKLLPPWWMNSDRLPRMQQHSASSWSIVHFYLLCSVKQVTVKCCLFRGRHWHELGYLILYITARPDMQQRMVVGWLSQHNFPHGMVAFMDGLSAEPLRQKTNYLRQLVHEVCNTWNCWCFLVAHQFDFKFSTSSSSSSRSSSSSIYVSQSLIKKYNCCADTSTSRLENCQWRLLQFCWQTVWISGGGKASRTKAWWHLIVHQVNRTVGLTDEQTRIRVRVK